MKTVKLFSLALLISIGCFVTAQNTDNTLVRIETPKFHKEHFNTDYIYVNMGFNDAEVTSKIKSLDVRKIESVTLVYTQFRASERFNQLALNEDRTLELMSLIPGLKNNTHINWFWVAQTNCNTPELCQDFFHGFEIKLKSKEDLITTAYEQEMVDYYTQLHLDPEKLKKHKDSLAFKKIGKLIKVCDTTYEDYGSITNRIGRFKPRYYNSKKRFIRQLNREKLKLENEVSLTINHRKRLVDYSGVDKNQRVRLHSIIRKNYYVTTTRIDEEKLHNEFMFRFKTNRRGKIKDYSLFSTPLNRANEEIVFDKFTKDIRQVIKCRYIDTSLKIARENTVVYDDVVTRVFDRNSHWHHCLVATDVTGSMYPYIGQFLAWHQLNLKTKGINQDFVFFNDGNNMRDVLKTPGRVGGVYYVKSKEYIDIKKICTKAQNKGSGGDGPENNIEAVLDGIANNPSVREVIMVADNWATPRDLKLAHRVNKPIHVILCGAQGGVNTAYLDLARETGGTVHTIEQDITELAKINEGEVIEINGLHYTISGGKFVQVFSNYADSIH